MIRKRGTFYGYEFMESRKRYFGVFNGRDGSPLATSKQHARELEAQIRLQIRAGTYQNDSDRECFATFFDHVFMVYAKEHKRSWRHDEFRGEVLKQFFGSKTFSQITPLLVSRFITDRLASTSKRHRTRSPVTVHKETQLLSSIFNMAITERVATFNPCTAIPKTVRQKLPARNKRDRFLSGDEEDRLFAALRGRRAHLFPLVRLALETGLRKGELCRLAVEHVNLSDVVKVVEVNGQRVDVRPGELLVTRGKNGRPRTVPLSARARAVALAQINDVTTGRYLFTSRRIKGGGPVSEIKTAFVAAVREAGIPDFRFHDLRHTFATRLNAAGVDVFTIRDLLGHSTTTMSSDYTHTSPEGRRAAIEKLDQGSVAQFPNSGKITASAC